MATLLCSTQAKTSVGTAARVVFACVVFACVVFACVVFT
jgi:hypothetical protein